MQATTGLQKFMPTVRKLGLGAGIALGISFILYGLGDIVLITDFVAQPNNVGVTQYIGISLFAMFLFFLFGISVIRTGIAFNGNRLKGRRLMSTAVMGAVYLMVQGAALLSYGNKIGGSTTVGTTLTNDGILLVASGIFIIAAGALLLQSGQSSRIAGGVVAIVAAALLTDLLNGQTSTVSAFGVSFTIPNITNISAFYTTGVLQAFSKSTLSTPGYFLSLYWAEIGGVILGAVGALAWAVLHNRKEAKYGVAVGLVGFLVYAIGLIWYGFATSTSVFNGLPSTSGLTGYASRVVSETQIVAWSLVIAGIGGILLLVASGFGLALAVTRTEEIMVRQESLQVPVSAMGGAICKKCGAQNRIGDTHCRSCGAALT